MPNQTTGLASGGKWYPSSIPNLEKFLRKGMSTKGAIQHLPNLRKNLAHSLQFTEFLAQVLYDINLSEALIRQTHKSFLTTSSGIIEGTLYYVVFSGNHGTTCWEKWDAIKSSECDRDGIRRKIETTVFTKLKEEVPIHDCKFKDMHRIAEKKKLLGTDQNHYRLIKYLNKMRNKVHLQDTDIAGEIDYNIFDDTLFRKAKACLATTLQHTIFNFDSTDKKLFPYLNDQFS